MLIALLASLAFAQDCPPPDRATLDALAQLSQQAVQSDAVPMHEGALEQFLAQAQCLRSPVPTEPWAQLLISEAIIRNKHGQDPVDPLATAMAIDPATWVPSELLMNGIPRRPPPGDDAPTVPEGTMLWVDGVAVRGRVPDVQGLHIVQMQRMTEFKTAIGALPMEVAVAERRTGPGFEKLEKGGGRKVKDPPEGSGAGGTGSGDPYEPVVAYGGLFFGASGAAQRTSEPREFIGNEGVGGLNLGVAGQVFAAPPGSPVRVWGALHGSPGRSGGLELAAGVGVPIGDVIPFAGIGASGVRLVEGNTDRKTLLGHPRVGARYSSAAIPGFDATASVGIMPASSFLSMAMGYSPVDLDFGQVRIGGEITMTGGRFVQDGSDWRTVGASRWRAGVVLGAAWGHIREEE